MKPNFTLSLSFDGLRLLHRVPGGWRLVGEVALDSADLSAELAMLRKTATALDPSGLRSLLLIPDEQIKYLTLETAGMDADARRNAAATALEGATPYAVSDLVFDVSADGPRSHVAAVARETLKEAEAFAVEHRFYPVAFSAAPEASTFKGAPNFGLTEGATDLLEPGEEVTPEAAPVLALETTPAPDGPIADTPRTDTAMADQPESPEAQPTETPNLAPTPAQSPPPDADALPDLKASEEGAAEPPVPAEMSALAATPEAPPQDEATLRPDQDAAASEPTAAPVPETTPETTPDTEPETAPKTTPAPTGTDSPAAPNPAPKLAATPKASPPPRNEPLPDLAAPVAPPDPAEPAGSVASAPAPLAAAAAAGPTVPSRKVDFSAPPSRGAPAAGFASRRPQDAKAAEAAPSLGGASRATPPSPPEPDTATRAETAVAPSTAADAKADPEAAAAPQADADAADVTPPALNTPSVAVAAPSPAAAPLVPQMTVAAPAAAAETPQPTAADPQPDSSSLTPRSPASGGRFLSRRKPKERRKGRHLTPAALAAPTAASEAERMTIFGARRRDEVGGKPRFLGLMLTAALLLFLAGVAAWASIFLDDGAALSRLFGDRSPRSTAEAITPETAPAEAPDEAIAVLPPEPAGPDAIETAALDAGLTDEDGAVLDALRAPDPRPVSEMTEAEIDAKYATTGIWPRAPQVPPAPAAAVDIDDLYLTSIDPISTTTDAIALPPVTGFDTDSTPGSVTSPAAAGTRFTLDASGLVRPTAEGALSPDGHLVVLGRPDRVPPLPLTRPAAEPAAPEVDPALAAARPRPRPADLSETTERAQLGLTRSELEALRPQLRPRSLQEIAAEAAAAETAAAAPEPDAPAPEAPATPVDTSDAVAAALAVPPAIENATKQATTQSRRPDLRPRNFARIVKRAERVETREAAASVAPKAVQPRFPSKTSVAKQATSKNAINLREVNLIGVYGKPSSRRALVRLSNGRYQKVEVGDRIDGGRVSAIGDSELRYTRRGRNVVLKMPN